jgi:POT family proton-dependent oligopeptide transporter
MLDKGVSTTIEDPQLFGHPKGLFYLFFAESVANALHGK